MTAPFGAWTRSLKGRLSHIRDFSALLSGSLGRLVLSLGYFVCVANSLTVAEFGLFAAASAVGIVLSRVFGLGFTSPLYRAATVKPRLVGVYTGGLVAASVVSVPLVLLGGAGFFLLVFEGQMAPATFAVIVAAEILGWRTLEIVLIVNNGLNRFARASALLIGGSAIRALAALLFYAVGSGALGDWALLYLGANLLAALLAILLAYPRRRLRLSPRLVAARWRDSLSVAGAEVVFYLQSELDKLLVLTFGGAEIAGLYAILMRLVDLTALPIRSFNTMFVQRLMRDPDFLSSWRRRWGIEGAIAAVSVGGLAALGGFLAVFPNALGENVAAVGPLVLAALLVPAFRNLVEYQSELLYARGRTTMRLLILAIVGLVKGGLLVLLLSAADPEGTRWIVGLDALFLVLWLVSAAASYTVFDWGGERGVPGRLGRLLGRRREGVSRAPQPGE